VRLGLEFGIPRICCVVPDPAEAPQSFTGWLELVTLLEGLRAGAAPVSGGVGRVG
jgi:hypothetical protein